MECFLELAQHETDEIIFLFYNYAMYAYKELALLSGICERIKKYLKHPNFGSKEEQERRRRKPASLELRTATH
jgi:hypothetical protein